MPMNDEHIPTPAEFIASHDTVQQIDFDTPLPQTDTVRSGSAQVLAITPSQEAATATDQVLSYKEIPKFEEALKSLASQKPTIGVAHERLQESLKHLIAAASLLKSMIQQRHAQSIQSFAPGAGMYAADAKSLMQRHIAANQQMDPYIKNFMSAFLSVFPIENFIEGVAAPYLTEANEHRGYIAKFVAESTDSDLHVWLKIPAFVRFVQQTTTLKTWLLTLDKIEEMLEQKANFNLEPSKEYLERKDEELMLRTLENHQQDIPSLISGRWKIKTDDGFHSADTATIQLIDNTPLETPPNLPTHGETVQPPLRRAA